MMNNIKILLALVFIFAAVQGWGQGNRDDASSIQVIVNVNSELTELNRKQVMSLFLGREWLTGKSISDIDAYWARLRYSGRTSPPRVISDLDTILYIVSKNQNAIAYIRQQDPAQLARQGIVVVHTLREL